MSRLHGLIPLDKPVMPIALMATFALPGTLSISLINSLNGIKKLKGLNREEKRRIDSIASRKVHRQIFLIVIYLLLSAGMGVAFFAATLPAVAPYLEYVLAAVGAALAFAVVCSVFAVIDSSELASFEAKIANRSAERKAKQALLKRLASKD
ncbi:hypothetical protein [Pseudomonas sp. MWU13-3659]|uniref:hypothetical protein n=1 Tax=Pseudomonas sp. MWU13-3659 TaxID=2986964 RepID=UPI00207518D5|nr:hypothetical protein [Pseudomonas sp. MWU13-3659]